MTSRDRSMRVTNVSTWLKPSAQKILVATTVAPLAPSFQPGVSHERNQVSPPASAAVNPGEAPALFSREITQRSGLGGGPTFGPRTRSSADSERGRMRLVNQLESGTSSIVLTSRARVFDGCRDWVMNRLWVIS